MKIPTEDGGVIDLVFIHIPKSGGSYVHHVFDKWILSCITQRPDNVGHLTWQQYNNKLKDEPEFNQAKTFAVVRNPWSWHVSWYHYIKQDVGGIKSGHVMEHYLFNYFTFEEYVHWLRDDRNTMSPQRFMASQQRDWLVDETGKIVVDRVIRHEQLSKSLRVLANDYNFKIKIPNISVNESEHGDYRTYYTTETAEIIRQKHADDIKLWGYRF